MFEGNDAVFVLKIEPVSKTIISANNAFKEYFSLKDVKGKSLSECLGCDPTMAKNCSSNLFAHAKVNSTFVMECEHLKRRFIVKYFEDKLEICNVMIFDNFENIMLDVRNGNIQPDEIDGIFSHEIKNIINRIFLTNQYLENFGETKADLDWYIKHTNTSLSILIDLLDKYRYYKHKTKDVKGDHSVINIMTLIDNLILREELIIKERKLVINKDTCRNKAFDDYLNEKYPYEEFLIYLMLSNVINNMVKYADIGSEADIICLSTENKHVIIVENFGVLTPYLKEHFFLNSKTEFQGSGYGLYFSKLISDRLGVELELVDVQGMVSVQFSF